MLNYYEYIPTINFTYFKLCEKKGFQAFIKFSCLWNESLFFAREGGDKFKNYGSINIVDGDMELKKDQIKKTLLRNKMSTNTLQKPISAKKYPLHEIICLLCHFSKYTFGSFENSQSLSSARLLNKVWYY